MTDTLATTDTTATEPVPIPPQLTSVEKAHQLVPQLVDGIPELLANVTTDDAAGSALLETAKMLLSKFDLNAVVLGQIPDDPAVFDAHIQRLIIFLHGQLSDEGAAFLHQVDAEPAAEPAE